MTARQDTIVECRFNDSRLRGRRGCWKRRVHQARQLQMSVLCHIVQSWVGMHLPLCQGAQLHVHANGDINNMMERFNGTMHVWMNHLRGFKGGKDPILEGMRVHDNHVRPHQGLGRLTPGEAAGNFARAQVAHLGVARSAVAEKYQIVRRRGKDDPVPRGAAARQLQFR